MPNPRPDVSHPEAPLAVEPWVDPVLDTVGHDCRSAYVERFWVVILGPSALLLLRLLADELDRQPDGFRTTLPDLARALGLSFRPSNHNVIVHAIERLAVMGIMRIEPDNTLAVRRRLFPLSARQLRRLPVELRLEHQHWVDANPRSPDQAQQRRRARRLALSLLELGDDPDTVERQLHRWAFHPALAHDAIRWAVVQHRARSGAAPIRNVLLDPHAVRASPGDGEPNPLASATSVRTP